MILFGEIIAGILNMHRGPMSFFTPTLSVCILKLKHINLKRVLKSTRKEEIVNGRKETDL